MQHVAGNAEPFAMNRLPLAASPQNVPESVDDCPIVGTWSSWTSFLGGLGQMLFDATPQWTWDLEVVDIFGLLSIFAFHIAPRWTFVFGQIIVHEAHLLFRSNYFSAWLKLA